MGQHRRACPLSHRPDSATARVTLARVPTRRLTPPPPPGPRPGPGPGGSRCAGILCEMQSIEEPEPKGEFECRLLEVCFTMNDPFTPHKDKFLILGSHCSLCNNAVCVGQECSLFYTKRFCIPCVKEHMGEFPEEIQLDLQKKKQQQKPQASK